MGYYLLTKMLNLILQTYFTLNSKSLLETKFVKYPIQIKIHSTYELISADAKNILL